MTTTTRHILAALCAAILLLNAPALRAGGNEIPGKPQDHPIVRRRTIHPVSGPLIPNE